MDGKAEGVIGYHERTRHAPGRYARGPLTLDWATQPVPFRRFRGAGLVRLPLLESDPVAGYGAIYGTGAAKPEPLSLKSVAALLELSLGLSAWKAFGGEKWALRMNPSSGNLHPTEAHLVLPPLPSPGPGAGGVYHYNPYLHALEKRASFGEGFFDPLGECLGSRGFLLALTSIFWREAWKYGERAFRYSCLDAGHALASVAFVARLLGWKAVVIEGPSDGDISAILGFDRTAWLENEAEVPEMLLFIRAEGGGEPPDCLTDGIIDSFRALEFTGEPDPLSEGHVRWEAIEEISTLAAKPRTSPGTPDASCGESDFLYPPPEGVTGASIIRKRRSGQSYDGRTFMGRGAFLRMMDATMRRAGRAPFDALRPPGPVHLLVFVHRVDGLAPGLYLLVRDPSDLERFRKSSARADFVWRSVEGADPALPLYLLEEGDFTSTASGLSCTQAIAGDSCFSLGMVARFDDVVQKAPWTYRRIHHEAGMIGQVLYLEATAHGLSATGIGCFFDDTVTDILGIRDGSYRSVYHFTVGKAVLDTRLMTLPPYHHLRGAGPVDDA